ncbi:ABC transporter permease [soil metagenome]
MDMLLQDLRYALRSLMRRPGFTMAALLTLGLGIGATTAIFSVIEGVLLRPLPFEEADRLVMVGQAWRTDAAGGPGATSSLNFADLREQTRSFEAMAQYSRATATVSGTGDAESVPAAIVTQEFFRVLRAQPLMGRTFTSDEDLPGGPHAIVLSYEYWQERLGGISDVLEHTLVVGGTPRPVVGVMQPGFEFPRGARLYMPARPDPETCGRGCIYLTGIGRLAGGVTLGAAQTDLAAVAQRLEEQYPESNRDRVMLARPLIDVIVGDMRPPLYVTLGAVFMVLLIACANVANLLLVRGAARGPELAVRTVLGAGRGRIVTQIMTENVLLAVMGGALGLVLASWGVDLLRGVAPPGLPRVDEIAVNGTTVLFASGLVLFTALLFGLAPALRLSRSTLAETLRGTGRGDTGGRQGWGRSAILVSEVALAVVLLLGAGLMMRSVARMSNVDTGFDTSGIAHFTLGLPSSSYDSPERSIAFLEEVKLRIAGLAGVSDVGLVMPIPLGPSVYSTSIDRTDRQSEEGRSPTMLLRVIDGNGLAVLGVSLSAGRLFNATDREGAPRVALINRAAAARDWPGEDPIGRQIEVGVAFGYEEDVPRTIVGIVDDIRALSLREAAEPEVLVPFAQSAPNSVTVVVSAADPGRAIAAARAEVRALDASLPLVRPGTVAELVSDQLAATRFFLLLLGSFAVLAVTLAAIGIYGVVAFAVAKRGREIGVRMALGARIQQVVALVVWQGVGPALLGLALGVVGAIAGGRIMEGLLFDIQPHDPMTFIGVTVLLLAIVVLACAVPATRASRIPPASSLRSE